MLDFCRKKMFEHRLQKMHRLQKIFLIMQKFLHQAAKITFCSVENPDPRKFQNHHNTSE